MATTEDCEETNYESSDQQQHVTSKQQHVTSKRNMLPVNNIKPLSNLLLMTI